MRQFLARQDGIQGGRGAEDASRMGLTHRRHTTCPRRVRRCIRLRLGIRLRPGMHLRLALLRLRHRPRHRRRELASAWPRPPHLAALLGGLGFSHFAAEKPHGSCGQATRKILLGQAQEKSRRFGFPPINKKRPGSEPRGFGQGRPAQVKCFEINFVEKIGDHILRAEREQ